MTSSIPGLRSFRLASRFVRRGLRRSLGKNYGVIGRAAFAGTGLAMASSVVLSDLAAQPLERRYQGRPNDLGHPARRLTDSILALNAIVFMLDKATSSPGDVGPLTIAGAKVNQLISAGEWWRFLTPALLHADLPHLLMNSFSLHNVGPAVELYSGKQRFLAVYTASAISGTLFSFLFSSGLSVGASGAIFGLTGALYVFYHRHQDLLGRRSEYQRNSILQVIGMNFVYGLMQPRIDNWGHLGGLVGGALVAYLLGPHLTLVQRRGKKALEDRPPLPWLAVRGSITI